MEWGGYGEFFGRLKRCDVPVLIFSAGLGDVLLEILKHNNVLSSNLSIRANFMHFSEEGLLQGCKEPLIHTFNKGEGHLASPTHTAHDRPNVLLLGDSLGDVSMADNLTNVMNVLRIGFLNDKRKGERPTPPRMTLSWRGTRRWTSPTPFCATSP
ncbi:cytosolic 5'-nucleotidase 3-like [Alosa sapidissima]|uniref:cytosolic 5'-nucleotidase 3-like n=1 Tax=Alosa sapidissima TaxID=34773 RepID=UPI001C09AC01|nr:cytosolic 5'-nucleotidase 3-like [Alosa sapidissima]